MNNIFSVIFLSIFFTVPAIFADNGEINSGETVSGHDVLEMKDINSIYDVFSAKSNFPGKDVFQKALNGYRNLKADGRIADHNHIITIIDFSKSSNVKRLWTINLKDMTVMHNTYVAHGRNSGNEYAKVFSNTPNSYQSSLGFYVTAETYYGKHGFSLRLDGVEADINHNARKRAIVMHGANYVSEGFIKKHGRLGRSYGCPSVPMGEHKGIINSIKEGSILFIYHPDEEYELASKLMKNKIRVAHSSDASITESM